MNLSSLRKLGFAAILALTFGVAWHGASAQLTSSPTSPISIGTIADGSALIQNIYINNAAYTTINGNSATLTGDTADFKVYDLQLCQGSFAPGPGVCTIQVYFAPVSVGNFSATLTIPYGSSQSLVINMSGTGTAQETTLVPITPSALQGYTTSSVTADNVYVFTNNYPNNAISFPGNTTQISITGTNASLFHIDASSSTCNTVIADDMVPGESCAESIYFTPPSTPGTYTATLNITYVAVSSGGNAVTQTATLTGTSLALPSQAGNPDLSFVPTVTKFAGNGTQGTSGNGGLATSAELSNPVDIAFDSLGNAYIADFGSYDVRKVDATTGNISLFAGVPGTLGNSGDGGLATSARFQGVEGLAVDANGNVYIADYGNNEVRVVYKGGTVPGLTGLTPGYIYAFAGSGNSTQACGIPVNDGGPATSADLCQPESLAFDADGNLFISEYGIYNNVRKVDTNGIITTYAGQDPGGSPSNTNGSLPDFGFSGDGGPATSAHLFIPGYIAIGPTSSSPVTGASSNLYIADINNLRVRAVNSASGNISTVVGFGADGNNLANNAVRGYSALNAAIDPASVGVDSLGQLYLSDLTTGGIFKVDTTGTITQYPSPTTSLAPSGALRFDRAGNFYIPSSNQYIYEIAAGALSNSLTFPSQSVGTTSAVMYLTLQNDGTGPLTFNSTPYTVTGNFAVTGAGTCNFSSGLASGTTCTVAVTFTPQSTGTLTGSITFASNATSSPSLVAQLSGTGYNLTTATLSQGSVAFGNQSQGTTSASQLLTLTNTSASAALIVSNIALSGSTPTDFGFTPCSPLPITIPAGTGNYCNISVNFTPQSNGAYSAMLTVTDNTTNGLPQTATLTGQGTPPAPLATLTPSSYTFPNTEIGATTTPVSFTLTNSGSALLTITNIAITSYTYIYTVTSTTCGATLGYTAGSNTCQIFVTSTPYFVGNNGTGQLTVTDNSGSTTGSTQNSSLYTTGLQGPTFSSVSYPQNGVYAENQSAIYQPFTATVSGGTPPYTFSFVANPGGSNWAITRSGNTVTLDGAPLAGSSYQTLNLTVTDSVGGSATISTGQFYVYPLTPVQGITANTTPISYGTTVLFTATENVPPTSVTPAYPTGTVNYAIDNGGSVASYTLTSGATPPISVTTDILFHSITVSYYGDSNYNGSTSYLGVNGNRPQTISFAGFNIPSMATVALTGIASSGLQVAYQVTSGNASIDGTGLNLVPNGTGPITVEATQAGNQSFAAAPPVYATFTAY